LESSPLKGPVNMKYLHKLKMYSNIELLLLSILIKSVHVHRACVYIHYITFICPTDVAYIALG